MMSQNQARKQHAESNASRTKIVLWAILTIKSFRNCQMLPIILLLTTLLSPMGSMQGFAQVPTLSGNVILTIKAKDMNGTEVPFPCCILTVLGISSQITSNFIQSFPINMPFLLYATPSGFFEERPFEFKFWEIERMLADGRIERFTFFANPLLGILVGLQLSITAVFDFKSDVTPISEFDCKGFTRLDVPGPAATLSFTINGQANQNGSLFVYMEDTVKGEAKLPAGWQETQTGADIAKSVAAGINNGDKFKATAANGTVTIESRKKAQGVSMNRLIICYKPGAAGINVTTP